MAQLKRKKKVGRGRKGSGGERKKATYTGSPKHRKNDDKTRDRLGGGNIRRDGGSRTVKEKTRERGGSWEVGLGSR